MTTITTKVRSRVTLLDTQIATSEEPAKVTFKAKEADEAEAAAPLGPPKAMSSEPPTCDFKFIGMPEDVQRQVCTLYERVVGRLIDTICDIGDDLLEMQRLFEAHCPTGTWSRFLAHGSTIKESTARNYMRAARARSRLGRSAIVAEKLPPTALYRLGDAPDYILQEVVDRIEADQSIKGKEIIDLINVNAPKTKEQTTKESKSEPDESSEAVAPRSHIDGDEEKLDQQASVVATADHPVKNRSDAIDKLIAQLRKHFADCEIINLDRLWQAAGPGSVQQYLR